MADDSKVKVAKVSKKAAKKAAKEAAKVQKKLEETAGVKQHKSKKGLIALLLAGAAGATAYFFWKRSQPVEDPWAEAYWEDIADSDAAADEAQTPDSAASDAEDENEKAASDQESTKK